MNQVADAAAKMSSRSPLTSAPGQHRTRGCLIWTWGGGGTQSSPLCKVTSINYSDTLTESRNLHYFGFKWLVWHFDECREIPLWSGNRGCRSETETLREHKRVFPKMSNSSCVRNNATMWNVRLLSDAPCLTLRLKQQYTLAGAAVKDQTSLI